MVVTSLVIQQHRIGAFINSFFISLVIFFPHFLIYYLIYLFIKNLVRLVHFSRESAAAVSLSPK